MTNAKKLADALWKIYRRPEQPALWDKGGTLPWDDPAFSERMLREHLDESHGAASRVAAERSIQIDWLWQRLNLSPQSILFDVTCGPGLYAVEFARRGCDVFGVDYSPAAIDYAQTLARADGIAKTCSFLEQDIRQMNFDGKNFDAAILLYGQLAVFPHAEAAKIVRNISESLKRGGKLCIEMLNPAHVDKSDSTWWFTDDSGLWGDTPFLHLGERKWLADENLSVETYKILHLETGDLDEIQLCDQVYSAQEMQTLLLENGFSQVEIFPAWDGLSLYDANEWLVYVATV